MLTQIFFLRIIAIEIFQISQENSKKKRVLIQICGLFQHFLALFETFTTLHNDPCIKSDDLANFGL